MAVNSELGDLHADTEPFAGAACIHAIDRRHIPVVVLNAIRHLPRLPNAKWGAIEQGGANRREDQVQIHAAIPPH